MNLDQFFELAKAHGPEGFVVALLVLGFIYVAKFSGLVKGGNMARWANVILSVVFGGFQFGNDESAFVTVIASIVSALLFTLMQWAAGKLPKPNPAKAKK